MNYFDLGSVFNNSRLVIDTDLIFRYVIILDGK